MKRRIKQILSAILVAIMLVGVMPITGFAEDDEKTFGYLKYTITDGEVTITNCDSSISGELTIPETIEGYPVTGIGSQAFYHANLTSIAIPNSVTSIEHSAFFGCTNLTSITIPDSVTSIANEVFRDCTGLTSITLSNSITRIDDRTFRNCTALTSITIPDSVVYIEDGVFMECTGLTSVTIPNGVINIGNGAFSGCTGLTSVTFPDSVVSIEPIAFESCNKLSDINLPNNLKTIGACAFYDTAYYKNNSNWENDVLYIGKYLIDAKKDIEGSYAIKNGTKLISNNAFSKCENLTNIIIPNSVTYINDSAFEGCSGLTSITIPDGVTSIKIFAFSNCMGLTSITVSDSVTSIDIWSFGYYGEYPFNKIPNFKIYCYAGTAGEKYAIDNGFEYELLDKTHTHILNHITVPSTCKVAGMEYDICTECGETLNEKTLPLAAHKWSDWTVVKEPTATTEGIEKRTCSVCGDSETRSIDKFNGIRDSETGVEIIYNDEYSDGTELKVEEKFSGKSFQLIDTAYGKTNTAIYDISTYKDGVKVQPNGEITVRVPLPKGFSANKVFVCYVDSTNGKVTKIPCEVKDGYVVFKTDHFSEYAVVEQLACVKSVSISDITLNYKKSATIKPTIKADDGARYTVKYSSSNTKVATVDKNGKVYGAKKGTATITCTVTDSNGNTVQDTCKVTVKYSFGQWLIVILLFGWIWY